MPESTEYSDPEFDFLPPAEPETPSAASEAVITWKPTVDFGGEFRSRFGQDLAYEYSLVQQPGDLPPKTKGTEDVVDFRNSISFWSRIGITEHIQVFAELYFEWAILAKRNEDQPTVIFNAKEDRHDLFLEAREAYFDFFYGPFSLRTGNQIISWGTLAVSGPVDRINPPDTRAYYWSDISGSRAPVLAVKANYFFEDFNFEAVWIPIFTPAPVDPYGGDFALFRYDSIYGFTTFPVIDIGTYLDPSKTNGLETALLSTKDPDANPVNSQAGARISASKGGFDFGVSYLFGYELLPVTHFDPEVRALGKAILRNDTNLATAYVQSLMGRLDAGEDIDNLYQSEYKRRHSVGAEFGTTVWELGIKAETVYLPEKTYYTEGLNAESHDTIAYAGGIDVLKTDLGALSTFYLDIEVFGSVLFDVPAGEQLLYSTEQNLGLFGNLRLAFLDDDLEIEVTSRGQFNTKDYLVVPKLTYQVVQDLRLTVGVMIIDALVHEPKGFDRFSSNPDRKDTLFGQYSNNDQAFIMLRYNF